MTSATSAAAASSLGDTFSRLGWHRKGVQASATAEAYRVAIQYRSEQHGTTRVVICDACNLMAWIDARAQQPGLWRAFLAILDRKDERTAPVQQPLLPLQDMPAPARRALLPD